MLSRIIAVVVMHDRLMPRTCQRVVDTWMRCIFRSTLSSTVPPIIISDLIIGRSAKTGKLENFHNLIIGGGARARNIGAGAAMEIRATATPQYVLTCPVLSSPVLSLRSACLVTHKGSGSQFHVCPRPCLSTCRWARLATHRHWRPLCVSPVLSCPLWPCNHRMCVIAREIGLSPLARTCSRTWVFLRRLPIQALSLCLTPFNSENHRSKKMATILLFFVHDT